MSAFCMSAVADNGPEEHRGGHRGFTLTSPDLASGTFANKFVLNGFGCAGSNVSPELRWSNVPPGTKSLALQVYDPDAPAGSGFWHWAVHNILTLFALGVPSAQAAGGIPVSGTAALYGFVINKGLGAALLGKATFTATYGR